MKKHYKVIKENPLWHVGAILVSEDGSQYRPLDNSDMWNVSEFITSEYLSHPIIENSPTYFQRVYPISLVSKTVYKLKEQALEYYEKTHKE